MCLCLIATKRYIYLEHNQVRISDAISSETRHAAPYNQHRNKLCSACVLRIDLQRRETKKRYKASLKKMSVDTYVGKAVAPIEKKKSRERHV